MHVVYQAHLVEGRKSLLAGAKGSKSLKNGKGKQGPMSYEKDPG